MRFFVVLWEGEGAKGEGSAGLGARARESPGGRPSWRTRRRRLSAKRTSPLVQHRPLVGGVQRFRFEQADVFRRLKGERLDQPRSLRRSSRPQSLLARTPSSTTYSSNADQRPGSSNGSWVDGAACRRDMLTHFVFHLLSFPTLVGPLLSTNQPTNPQPNSLLSPSLQLNACRRVFWLTLQEVEPQFEPVHKLTEQVAVTTGEENDAVIFKMYVLSLPLPPAVQVHSRVLC